MTKIQVDLLVAEIGSTTTTVNAFHRLDAASPQLLGQGISETTAAAGDVNIGLEKALVNLAEKLGGEVVWQEFLASSSAAGGLKMTVHGLVYQMTVKAAKEAALGAGAVVRLVTAGEISPGDLQEMGAIKPNVILLAGGVDYGEKATVVNNARTIVHWLRQNNLKIPVVYCGNKGAAKEAAGLFAEHSLSCWVVDNVYPRIDQLHIEPTRRAIQQVFSEHIVEAQGMNKIRRLIGGEIMSTPGAVMEAARLVSRHLDDILVFDVGGATTDVHSVTGGAEEIQRILIGPEPEAKRTVEGDLGVYVNAPHLVELIPEELRTEFGDSWMNYLKPIPSTDREIALSQKLTYTAVRTALFRHVGHWRYLYGPTGRQTVAEGKDLTKVKWVIGTGGALVRLPGGTELMAKAVGSSTGQQLMPQGKPQFLLDRHYIMAAIGVMAQKYPEAGWKLLKESLGVEERGSDKHVGTGSRVDY